MLTKAGLVNQRLREIVDAGGEGPGRLSQRERGKAIDRGKRLLRRSSAAVAISREGQCSREPEPSSGPAWIERTSRSECPVMALSSFGRSLLLLH
jgi:hypothetical protein